MRKKLCYLIVLLSMFMMPLIVRANSISSIDMDIYVDKNGTAHVTEKWTARLNEGTEGYKPYYNLGNAKFSNFRVSENGKEYTFLNSWNPSASFSSKAYKNGINYIDNGLELCWGISEYGSHVYTLKYDIEGFVATVSDADMVYWTLIPYELSSKPGNVHIKLYTDERFSDEVPVWGYGNYGGTAYVYDGYVEMNSEGTLQSNEYMTLLIKFDKGTFLTSNTLSNNFDHYFQMAEEGATKYQESGSGNAGFVDTVLPIIFMFFWVIIIAFVIKSVASSANKIGSYQLTFNKKERDVSKDVPNFRDIPFGSDIYRAYWIAVTYRLIKQQTDFLGAIILKWLKEGKISIQKFEKQGLLKTKGETAIDLTKNFDSEVLLEKELHAMMYEASKDGILESKEFEKWCNNNYDKILKWFNKVLDYETEKLIEEGNISVTERKTAGIINTKVYQVNSSMLEEAKKLKGLKNFLEEFSRIDDKEAIEVNLWEYYLIYAQILGIADKVAKQFKKLYPNLIANNEYGAYDINDIIFINIICYSGMRSASLSMQRAQSYSSGGGGFSSGGGGGGSFGGGGGGGGFR
ncbi:MAG: DUF2207 domain-containing protein [Bacilli bacterium]|nr:DUF2207 domain-containing protein [Bacilli bacterium]